MVWGAAPRSTHSLSGPVVSNWLGPGPSPHLSAEDAGGGEHGRNNSHGSILIPIRPTPYARRPKSGTYHDVSPAEPSQKEAPERVIWAGPCTGTSKSGY